MNSLPSFIATFTGMAPYTVGLVLLHFLWQATLLAAVLALVLRTIHHQSAQLRHALSCGTLVLMVLCPVFTFGWISGGTDFGGGSGTPSQMFVQDHSNAVRDTTNPGGQTMASWGVACLPWLTCAWLIGVSVLAMRLVGGWWQVHRLATREVRPAASEWQHRLLDLQARLRITVPVRLVESTRVQSPMVIGWIRPVILLPVGLLTGMPVAQIEALLLHELAHIRGNDYLINLLQRIAETLLFYHPAVWWVSDQIRRERENRCDDAVLDAMGEARSLAGALVALVEQNQAAVDLAMASSGGSVTDRVRRMLGAKPSTETTVNGWRTVKWGITAGVLMMLGYLVMPTLLAPKLYKATSRIRIDVTMDGKAPPQSRESYDPYMVLIHAEKLRSWDTLTGVVNRLELAKRWKLNPPECIEFLRSRLRVQQYRNTDIFEVTAASEDKAEAAELANAAVSVFQERVDAKAKEEQSNSQRFISSRVERLKLMRMELKDDLRLMDQTSPELNIDRFKTLSDRLAMVQQLLQEEEKNELIASLDRPIIKTSIDIIDSAQPELKPVRWVSRKP